MPSPPVSTELLSQMVRLRRDLHQHPERSWQEEGSAARVEAELRSLGLTPRRIAKTGVVVDVPGQRTQPLVALRADLDALPIQEETGLPFASQSPGLMHACAHDGHSAIAVGAAALLIADPPPLPVRILFQPAEEVAQGARALLAEVQTNEPEFKTEALNQTILRLDLAIANLPAFPVVAVGDVDIALQLLMSDLPDGLTFPTATPSPTPLPTEFSTETPTPEATVTPTPEVTATP